jgi:hypothetical protein
MKSNYLQEWRGKVAWIIKNDKESKYLELSIIHAAFNIENNSLL